MKPCKECGSWAINHHCHGRNGSDIDLCDVCYWRKRAGQPEPAPRMADAEIETALRKAYSLGQTYWQQADSEYTSQWTKASATADRFKALIAETIEARVRGET